MLLKRKVVKAVDFIKEVRAEVKKISWPTRRETMGTVALVFFMVTLMGLFFLVIDSVVYKVIQFILGL